MHLTQPTEAAFGLLKNACSVCKRSGHISTAANPCTRGPAPWNKVGIEIEGYWRWKEFRDVRELADDITGSYGDSDGSLMNHYREPRRNGQPRRGVWDADDDLNTSIVSGGSWCDGHEGHDWAAWEFRTKADTKRNALSQLLKLYPHGTNCRASMHVHVSFTNPTDLALLKTREFFDYWAKAWHAWGLQFALEEPEFWSRLAGQNSYCKLPILPDEDRADSDHGRYRQLNFVNAFRRHSTLECRLLPMFRNPANAVMAVEALLHIYDAWITGAGESAAGWEARAHEVMGTVHAVSMEEPLLHLEAIPGDYEAGPGAHSAQDVLDTYPTVPSPGYRLAPALLRVIDTRGYNARRIQDVGGAGDPNAEVEF